MLIGVTQESDKRVTPAHTHVRQTCQCHFQTEDVDDRHDHNSEDDDVDGDDAGADADDDDEQLYVEEEARGEISGSARSLR